MSIDRDYILQLAANGYKKNQNDFNDKMLKKDVYTFFVVRKMIKRFLVIGILNEKLILNNIIICLNIFGINKTNTIFRIICDDHEFSIIKSCLIFLNSYKLINDSTKPNRIVCDILNDISHRYQVNPKDEITTPRRMKMKNIIIQYILRRLTETSTIRGIVLFVTSAAGLALSPEQTNASVYIVLGIVGLIGTLLPDNIGKAKETLPPIAENQQEQLEASKPISPSNVTESEYLIPKLNYNKTKIPTTETGWNNK